MDFPSLIHDQIAQYLHTSKSRGLKRLNFQNKHKIIHSVNKQLVLETVNKKNHYSQKLYTILHDACKDGYVNNCGLDPEVITHRYLAQKYWESIVDDDYMMTQLTDIRYQHKQYLEDMKKKRIQIENKYKEIIEGFGKVSGLTKLAKFNETKKGNDVKEKEKERDEELYRIDKEMMFYMKKYEMESVEKLKELRVPFFCLKKEYECPGMEGDKEWMLGVIEQSLRQKEEGIEERRE